MARRRRNVGHVGERNEHGQVEVVRVGVGEHFVVEVPVVRVDGVERDFPPRLGTRPKPAGVFETVFRNRPMTTTNSPFTMCEKHNEMHRTDEPCRVCEAQKTQSANASSTVNSTTAVNQQQLQRTVVSNV
jgi:hypothetical protein